MAPADRPDSTERIVNLAMYLSAARAPVTWEDIRSDVAGYPCDQAQTTFLRMLERDKKTLREAGLVIESDAQGSYSLDESATFTSELHLSAEEAAAVGAAATAFLDDPGFPFAEDLRMAVAKLGPSATHPATSSARIADEMPAHQGGDAAQLAEAARQCKRVTFEYTTSAGSSGSRHVEPYGIFVREGRWYLVGYDLDRDALRTFTLARFGKLEVNESKQETPDFERPGSFDVATYVLLPFQFGAEEFDAVLRFDADIAWRAESLTTNRGSLETGTSGELVWKVKARSRHRLLRWVIESGPGITIDAPTDLVHVATDRLREVASSHE